MTQITTTRLKTNAWFKPKQVLLHYKKQQIQTHLADGFLLRLRGLLWSKPLAPSEGLLLSPCNSVHTIGMAYPIDIIFLSPDMQVLQIHHDCRPYRFANCKHAKHTLELLAGQAEALKLRVGMQLNMTPLEEEANT